MRAARLEGWVWVRWLALLAVLAHAGMAVRHNVHALGGALAASILAEAVICGGEAGATMPGTGHERRPDRTGGPCPVCSGSAGQLGTPPAEAAIAIAFAEPVQHRATDQVAEAIADGEPPPNRGPPSAA